MDTISKEDTGVAGSSSAVEESDHEPLAHASASQRPPLSSAEEENDSDWEDYVISERLEKFKSSDESCSVDFKAYSQELKDSESDELSDENSQRKDVVKAEIHGRELNEEKIRKLKRYTKFKKLVKSRFQFRKSEESGIEAGEYSYRDIYHLPAEPDTPHETSPTKSQSSSMKESESSSDKPKSKSVSWGTVDEQEVVFMQFLAQYEMPGAADLPLPSDSGAHCVYFDEGGPLQIDAICSKVRDRLQTPNLKIKEKFDFGEVRKPVQRPFRFVRIGDRLERRARIKADKKEREIETADIVDKFESLGRPIQIYSLSDMIGYFVAASRMAIKPIQLARQMNAKALIQRGLSYNRDRTYHTRGAKRILKEFEDEFEYVRAKSKEILDKYVSRTEETDLISDLEAEKLETSEEREMFQAIYKMRDQFLQHTATRFSVVRSKYTASKKILDYCVLKMEICDKYLNYFLRKPKKEMCRLSPKLSSRQLMVKEQLVNQLLYALEESVKHKGKYRKPEKDEDDYKPPDEEEDECKESRENEGKKKASREYDDEYF